MKKQAVQCNIRLSHWGGPSGDFVDVVVGKVIEVLDSSKNILKIKFKILKSYSDKIKEYVEAGINLGLSIGAKITKYERVTNSENKTSFLKILDVLLIEITLTSLPVNWDTYGTVTTSKGLVKSNCFSGACYQIFKNLNEEDILMSNDNGNENNNGLSDSDLEKIKNMLNEGLNKQTDVIANKVQSELEPKLKSIVNEVLAENNNDNNGSSGKSQGETTPGENNENNIIAEGIDHKAIAESMAEEITKKVKEDLLGEVNKNRQPQGSDNDSDGNLNNENNGSDANKSQPDHLGLVPESPEDIAKTYNPSKKSALAEIFNL